MSRQNVKYSEFNNLSGSTIENGMRRRPIDNVKQILGNRIRFLRRKQDLTQQTLGEKSDINYKFLGSIERGQQNPSLEVLYNISKSLGIDLHELFKFNHKTISRKKTEQEISKIVDSIIENMEDDQLHQLHLILKIIFTFN